MNTMQLLDKALQIQPVPYWTKQLKLSRGAIHAAKTRGHLSPAIAGALADELGENYEQWMLIAAMESERDSACKSRMMRKIATGVALSLGAAGPALAHAVCILCKVDQAHVARASKKLKALTERKQRSSLTD